MIAKVEAADITTATTMDIVEGRYCNTRMLIVEQEAAGRPERAAEHIVASKAAPTVDPVC